MRMLNRLLYYGWEQVLVLELLPCLRPTQWTWFEAGLLYRLRNLLVSTEACFMLYLLCFVRKVSVLYTRVGFRTVIGVVPYVGLNFAVYESLKDWLIKAKAFGLGITTRLACAAAAGTVGQTVAYPLDVIRRRMQMVGWHNAASIVTGDGRSRTPLEYTGMIDAFRKTVRHEGFRALYRGLIPNSVKVVPSISIAFVTYEQVKELLGVEIRIFD